MIVAAAIAVALAFLAAFAGMLLGRRIPASLIAVVPMIAATVLTGIVALDQWNHPRTITRVFTRVPTGSLHIGLSLEIDGLAAVVAFMVCVVALAVQVYSVTYMKHDPRYSSYAAFISLFTSAMLLVVVSGDLLVLYVGWEVMGVCSYFLIGHHSEDRANSRAAVKAFLVTRLGDVGFLFGIFVLGVGVKSFDIRTVVAQAPNLPHTTLTVGTLLLLAGVAGKSAQFPLHTWLPDAMAGPTPISALIHAATMVAAGIYVVARLYPAFEAAPTTLAVLGVMAAISMVGAALAALAQDDLKRVLAYSTISQLAYMAAGLAVGTRDGAVFHLLTHAAFKALLFLAAGCVIVTVGSNMMSAMGGLRHSMPVTFVSMTIGFAALAGAPPASGFFSKDTILSQAWRAVHSPMPRGRASFNAGASVVPALPSWVAWLVFGAALFTVALTAAYATRAWLLTFFGEQRSDFEAAEADPLMRWPVAVLAVPALILGFFGLGSSQLRPELGMTVVSLAFAVVGGGAVYLIWNIDPALDPARLLGSARAVFLNAFYVDAVYTAVIVRPVVALATAVVRADDGIVNAAVEGAGHGAGRLGGLARRSVNGNPQAYLTGVLAGVALIAIVTVALA